MNENQSIQKQPFGFNVALPKKSFAEIKKVAQQEVENITVNPFVNYLEENDKVFSGQVAKEIRKYQSQMYTLGQIVREGQPQSTFNIKF